MREKDLFRSFQRIQPTAATATGGVWPKPDKVNIGETEYDTLTLAVAAASSGDTIIVGVGTFTETVTHTIPDGVNIIAADRDNTVIENSTTSTTIIMGNGYMANLTVTNSRNVASGVQAVQVANGKTATIQNCILEGNNANGSGSANGLRDESTGTVVAINCECKGTGSGSARYGYSGGGATAELRGGRYEGDDSDVDTFGTLELFNPILVNSTTVDGGSGTVKGWFFEDDARHIDIVDGGHAPSIPEGRLTLTTSTPVTTSDVTGAGTIYYTPYTGDKIDLYDGTYWQYVAFTEKSVSVPTTLYRLFDVWGYLSSGTLALETDNWTTAQRSITNATNATPIVCTSTGHGFSNGNKIIVTSVTGNTAANGTWTIANVTVNTFELQGSVGNGAYVSGGLAYQMSQSRSGYSLTRLNGRLVKSTDNTRRFIGIGMTTGTIGQCDDAEVRRGLWNAHNQVRRKMLRAFNEGSGSHVYGGTNVRYFGNVPLTHSYDFIVGEVEKPFICSVGTTLLPGASGRQQTITATHNVTTGATASSAFFKFDDAQVLNLSDVASIIQIPSLGFNFVAGMEQVAGGGGNCTYFDSGGISGWVMA